MKRLSDTSPEAERVLIEAYRRMPLARKWQLVEETYQLGRMLHAAGARLRNPSATPRDILADWLAVNLGVRLAATNQESVVDPSALRGLRAVTDVLTRLGIAHALGGSMASSVYGINRSTQDADLTVEPFPGKEAQLMAAFGEDYYLSPAAVHDAVRNRTSFNIINTATGFKVDVFVCKDQGFERSALDRRVAVPLPHPAGESLNLLTPEDLILFKLRWYRLGNESSEQQWKDVIGVFRIQAEKLDPAYLDRWAPDLGVADLLDRARQESRP
jgi:hypothetical protein